MKMSDYKGQKERTEGIFGIMMKIEPQDDIYIQG